MSTNTIISDLCISGASISRCPWITWVDCLIEALNPQTITNHSCKGAGNQYILSSAVDSLQKSSDNKLLAVMFTNFDKYDMWVEGDLCEDLKGEKHPPAWIDGNPADLKGFWCTGSHFPGVKEIYKNKFFNLELAATQNLSQMVGLTQLCQHQEIPCLIMFDSPIFDYTENQINQWAKQQVSPVSCHLDQSAMINPWLNVLQKYLIDTQGLIGYCMENNLPWYNKKYGTHPPSVSHYRYFIDRIMPWIQNTYPNLQISKPDSIFEAMVEKMTNNWIKNAF